MKKKKQPKVEKRVSELENQLKKALADYHNLSKRIEEKQGHWRDRASAGIIDKMLDVYEDLLRAKQNIKDNGLSMAVNQFWAILESEGVKEVNAKGKEFDAETMDCVQVVDGEKNIVVEVIGTGYLFKDYVIRPAKVKVGRGEK